MVKAAEPKWTDFMGWTERPKGPPKALLLMGPKSSFVGYFATTLYLEERPFSRKVAFRFHTFISGSKGSSPSCPTSSISFRVQIRESINT